MMKLMDVLLFDSSISNEDASLKNLEVISKLNYKSPLINTCVKMFNCYKLQVRFLILNYISLMFW
jgi:hypothetical protein